MLVEADINDNRIPDVIKFNIITGKYKTIMRGNTKQQGSFVTDADGEVRAASGWNPAESSINLYARRKGSKDWELTYKISSNEREEYQFLGFDKENPNNLYIRANLGQDKAGIYTYNLETKIHSDRLFGLEDVDVDGVIFINSKAVGYGYTSKNPERYYEDPYEEALYRSLKKLFKDKVISMESRSRSDNAIVVLTRSDSDTGSYYLISNKKSIKLLGERFPLIDKSKLGKVKFITYKSRDGRKTNAYVTIPSIGKAPYPTVVMPHGGPWARDVTVFDEWSQMLASHGYLVIQPQFRGSTGFGLEHWKAGDKMWGLTMQDDMDDAAMFLVNKGLASKDKLAMFGWSYGGYSAFVGSMRDNNIYQCTVAGAGVSDLGRIKATLLDNPIANLQARPFYKGLSPLDTVEKVNVPILVIHGDIDERVPVEQSRLFVDKLKKYKKDFKYVELKDADHFYNTLFYNHKKEFYGELVSWLDNKCGMKI